VTVFLLTIPSSVGLLLLGESMIGIVYQHGHFLPYDTHQTSVALSFYALGLAGYAAVKLLAPAFYALGDARTPMFVSLASVAVNTIAAIGLVYKARMGYPGLALSLSLVSTFNAVILATFIRPRLGGINGRAIAISLAKILLAAAVMGAAVYGITALQLPRALNILLGVPVGAAIFYFTASALDIPELAEARDAALRKFRSAP
jgi:putative peptidoglycan lipid II flippase